MRKLCLLLLLAVPLFADDFSYIYMRDNVQRMHNGNVSFQDAIRTMKRLKGKDVLWARVDGRDILIEDAATLDQVAELFKPLAALDPERQEIRRRLRPLERREQELDEKIDALEDNDQDATDLKAELRKVEREMRVVERDEERFERREEKLEAEVEAQLKDFLRSRR